MHNMVRVWTLLAVSVGPGALELTAPTPVFAQETADPATPATRESVLEQAEAEKVKDLHPYVLSEGERLMNKAEDILANGLTWRPYFESAYQGGGFPFGVGYRRYVSPYNVLDVRGSYTLSGYKRAEAEFIAPHLFHRRGAAVDPRWLARSDRGRLLRHRRGLATRRTAPATHSGSRTPPPRSRSCPRAVIGRWPAAWNGRSGISGPATDRSRRSRPLFTPQTLPGLGADVTYIHSQGTIGFDWRPFPGYARRGGYYGVTVHDYTDTNGRFGFNQIDYEAIQHVPILREAWVITLHGLAQTAYRQGRSGDPVLHAAVAGRRLHAARLQLLALPRSEQPAAAGRVAHHGQPLLRDRGVLRHRQGRRACVRSRFRTSCGTTTASGSASTAPTTTLLRIDVARSQEGTRIVFAAGHVF